MNKYLLNYEDFKNHEQAAMLESVLTSIHKDITKKLSQLGLGTPDNLSDKDMDAFVTALLNHDGDLNAVKEKDIHEAYKSDKNEENVNESVYHVVGIVGEVLGLGAGLSFLIEKIMERTGRKGDSELSHKVHKFLTWIDSASFWETSLIKRVFEFIGKLFGLKGKANKLFGTTALLIFVSVLVVTTIMTFPAIGHGFGAMVVASLAIAAKSREIWILTHEIYELIQEPSDADLSKYADFYDKMGEVFKNNKEKIPPRLATALHLK